MLALLLAACLLGAWQRPPIRAAGLGARQGQPSSWTPATRLASGVFIGTAIVWVLFFWNE
ncbi:MAG: hypothetical protein ACRD26_03905 [Vicinamibacterales bacterium]